MKEQIALVFAILLISVAAKAQDASPSEIPVAEEQGVEEASEADQIPELVFEESQASDEESNGDEEESGGRFIPSEEISQDLGVSFPANI